MTGSPVAFPGYGALGTAVVFVEQQLRNAGEDCVLQLPDVIGVTSRSGESVAIPVQITVDPPALAIEAGQSFSIVLGDSWSLGVQSGTGASPLPAPTCDRRIGDVGRITFPLAAGTIDIAWDTSWIWKEVCVSPPSVTVAAELSLPPLPVGLLVTRAARVGPSGP